MTPSLGFARSTLRKLFNHQLLLWTHAEKRFGAARQCVYAVGVALDPAVRATSCSTGVGTPEDGVKLLAALDTMFGRS